MTPAEEWNGSPGGGGESPGGHLIRAVAGRWRLIAGITAGAAVVSAVVSLLLPPTYRAETRVLPPQGGTAGMAAQVLSQLGGAGALLGAAALSSKLPGELYVEMLRSRTVLDRMVERFRLMETPGVRYREDARLLLSRRLRAKDDKRSGILTIWVEDGNPHRAAELANAFVEELRRLARELAVTEAAQRRLFFEERVKEAGAGLARAENDIRGFQEKTGALQIDMQARTIIERLAYLRAQISAKEVQLKVLRSYAAPQNPDLQREEEEWRALKTEQERLESGRGRGADPLMPTGRMPAVGTEYLRRLRDLKYNEALYELLGKQYELARIDEARDAAVIQVVDLATPPERRAGPRRTVIVSVSTLAGFIVALLLALSLEYVGNLFPGPGGGAGRLRDLVAAGRTDERAGG